MTTPPADRYGADILLSRPAPRAKTSPPRQATLGLVVEDVETGWCGAVVLVEKSGGQHIVSLEDRRGKVRSFPLGPGFLVDGLPVTLVPAQGPSAHRTASGAVSSSSALTVTRSGSVAVAGAKARVARASRIWVEGRHDAELVEKVWGDDLRLEGIVVEPLHGADDLAAAIADFRPGPQRRLGVLLDHLVTGSKETRIRDEAMKTPHAQGNVLILGHPFVDIWQAIKPQTVGMTAWPTIVRGQSWKHGILAALGRPATTQADVAASWQWLLGRVNSYADLEPALLGRVEELVDFVTQPTCGG